MKNRRLSGYFLRFLSKGDRKSENRKRSLFQVLACRRFVEFGGAERRARSRGKAPLLPPPLLSRELAARGKHVSSHWYSTTTSLSSSDSRRNSRNSRFGQTRNPYIQARGTHTRSPSSAVSTKISWNVRPNFPKPILPDPPPYEREIYRSRAFDLKSPKISLFFEGGKKIEIEISGVEQLEFQNAIYII